MIWLDSAVLGCAVALCLAAAWTDIMRREVPHWLIAGLAGLWGLAAVVAPESLGASPWVSLMYGGAALALGFALHALGWLGGGDGKLLAALALRLGPADAGVGLLASGIVGALLILPALLPSASEYRRRGIPCAVALAPPAATLLTVRAVS